LVDFCDEMMKLTLYYSQVEKLISHCGSNVVEASLGTAELATERFLAKSMSLQVQQIRIQLLEMLHLLKFLKTKTQFWRLLLNILTWIGQSEMKSQHLNLHQGTSQRLFSMLAGRIRPSRGPRVWDRCFRMTSGCNQKTVMAKWL